MEHEGRMNTVKSAEWESSGRAKPRRKYLGEANDPHFVPSSPIITRQSLTYELEEELTKSCSLVLAGVQHTDDHEEDPLMKYITAHVTAAKPVKTTMPKDISTRSKSMVSTTSQPSQKSQKVRRTNVDTATPSDTSNRDTLHRTDASTPLTILSESARRSSSHKQSAALRNEVRRSKSQALYGSSERSRSGEHTAPAAKSTTSLNSLEAAIEQQSARILASKGLNVSVTHVEFDKHLPPLPGRGYSPTTEKQSTGFSRLIRTVKNKQTSPATSPVSQRSADVRSQRAQTPFEATPPKKSRFNFASLFERGKKKQQAQVAAQ